MRRLIRDTVVAIAGGVVVSLIFSFTTSLTRIQLVGVGIFALALCALVLGAPWVYGVIKRRRDARRAKLVADVKAAVLAELAPHTPKAEKGPSVAGILAPSKASARRDRIALLRSLCEDGRAQQARLGSWDRTYPLLSTSGADLARWEAKAKVALERTPDLLSKFENVPAQDAFTATAGSAYDRIEHQLEVIEAAARDLGESNSRDDG